MPLDPDQLADEAIQFTAAPIDPEAIERWREMYRSEMACQIIHESIHWRPGWTREYVLRVGSMPVGYGSVAVAGPWAGTPTVYEVYIGPEHPSYVFDLCRALLDASGAVAIEVQTNDALSTVMLDTFAHDVKVEAILFDDRLTTTLPPPPNAVFRTASVAEAPDANADQLRWRGVVEVDGTVAATGGVLFHYNRPYGDVYMDVAEPFRRRGLGTFIVQELKRLCYEGGYVPAARCSPGNVASHQTLQRAGFAPCGQILKGSVPNRREPATER